MYAMKYSHIQNFIPKITYNKKISNRKNKNTIIRAEHNVILPEFLTLYAHSICNPRIVNLTEFKISTQNTISCLESIQIPSLDVQSNILRSLHSMAMITDISGFEGQFIKLMMNDDRQLIKELFEAIVNYNIAIDDLNKIIAMIPEFAIEKNTSI